MIDHKNAAGALYKQQCHISHVCSHSNSNNWHNHVQSLLKDAWNSRVFICRLNATYDSADLSDAGRAFQARAAATGNARSPSVVRRVSICRARSRKHL